MQRLLPPALRAASFRVSFVDADVRVTRGDRGELRVFQRAAPLPGGTAGLLPDPGAD